MHTLNVVKINTQRMKKKTMLYAYVLLNNIACLCVSKNA